MASSRKMRDSSSRTASSHQQQSPGEGGEVWSMEHSYGVSLSLSHSFTNMLLHMCHHNNYTVRTYEVER